MTTWRAITQETHIRASFSDLRGRRPGRTALSHCRRPLVAVQTKEQWGADLRVVWPLAVWRALIVSLIVSPPAY